MKLTDRHKALMLAMQAGPLTDDRARARYIGREGVLRVRYDFRTLRRLQQGGWIAPAGRDLWALTGIGRQLIRDDWQERANAAGYLTHDQVTTTEQVAP